MRTCIEPGCHKLTKQTRCAGHQQPLDQAKGAQPHRRINQIARKLGPATVYAKQHNSICSICGHHKQPTQAKRDRWHWHHTTPGDPHSPQAPAHEHCNTSYGDGTR